MSFEGSFSVLCPHLILESESDLFYLIWIKPKHPDPEPRLQQTFFLDGEGDIFMKHKQDI